MFGVGAMRHARFLLHFISFFLVTLVLGQPRWMYDVYFGATDRSILAPVINGDQTAKEALRFMLNYYKNLEGNITQSPALTEDVGVLENSLIRNELKFSGWPQLNKFEKVILYRPEKRFERIVFEALVSLGKSLDKSGSAVKQTVGWNKVFHNNRKKFTTETKTLQCTILSNLAYRMNNRWVAGVTITNREPEEHLGEGKRLYLQEYIYLDGSDMVRAEPFYLNMTWNRSAMEFWRGGPISPNRTRATTKIARFGGRAGLASFSIQPLEETVHHASKVSMQKAHDLISVGNMAQLVLPMVATAVPIALLEDVSARAMLVFVIFTDVLTLIPLAIQGMELIALGMHPYFATSSTVYGDITMNGTVAVETSTVRCTSTKNLIPYGAFCITVALSAMILGIALEFLVRAKAQKKKRMATTKTYFGCSAVEHLLARVHPCNECKRHALGRRGEKSNASQLSIGGVLLGQVNLSYKKPK